MKKPSLNLPIPLNSVLIKLELTLKFIKKLESDKVKLQDEKLTYETGLVIYNEVLNFYLKPDNSYNQFLETSDSFVDYYRGNNGAMILLHTKINKLFEPYYLKYKLYEQTNDFEEILNLQGYPLEFILSLNQSLEIRNLNNRYSIDLEIYRSYVNVKTFKKILFYTINFVMYSILVDLVINEYNISNLMFEFKHKIGYGISLNAEKQNKFNSFFYKRFSEEEPTQLNNGKILLEQAFDMLKYKGFIDNSVAKRDFFNIFRNTAVTKPIIWTAYKSDLSYFLTLIHTKYKVIKPIRRELYNVAKKIFVDKNGDEFETEKFNSDKPTKENSSILDSIVFKLL
jgi:hypothetical protein